MTSSKKTLPKFNEKMSYSAWTNKVKMWEIVTSVDKKERVIIVLLDALEGNVKAEKAVQDLRVEELNTTDGTNILSNKLDVVFKSEKVDEACNAYPKFITFQKHSEMTMTDIVEYEHLYCAMVEHDMQLPDNVQALKLLDLSEDDRKLVLASANDIKIPTMQSALKCLFSVNQDKDSDSSNSLLIKQEAFYSKKGSFSKGNHKKETNLNPLNKKGQVLHCVMCDSKMHRAKNCLPKKSQQVNYIDDEDGRDSDDSEEVNIVFITEEVSQHDIFIAEAAISAAVDTACTKTAAGESWFINCYKKLDNILLNEIEICPSKTFKFGDGRKVFSFQKVVILVQIANHSCKISCEIVKGNIPLLLSKQSLKRAGAIINMQNNEAIIFDTEVDFHLSTNGHYCVEIYPNASIYTNKNQDTVQKIFFLEETLSKKHIFNSYSPWINRLCERHNQTLTNMFLKIREDIKCDMNTALAWAESTKNTLINNNAFSPAQRAFGKNCMFPSIINNNLPALGSSNQSPNLALHIVMLHSAQRAFIACESSEKIK